ncbi:hypothetical protein D3C84_841260 [compost metagenome]
MVGVLEGRPAFAQGLYLDLGIRLDHRRLRLRLQIEFGALLLGAETLHQRLPGGQLAVVGEEHLVHRHTLLVEDLDAALGATRGLLRHREDAGPAAHEQAQVDIGRYHQPHLTVGHHRNFAVVAFTLMHAMLVAGQRHDVAQLAQRR